MLTSSLPENSAIYLRNRENFKTAIYFHCDGLNLDLLPTQYPDEPKIVRGEHVEGLTLS